MFYHSKNKCQWCDKFVEFIESNKDEFKNDFPLEFGIFDFFLNDPPINVSWVPEFYIIPKNDIKNHLKIFLPE